MFIEEKKNSQIYQDSNYLKPDTEIGVSNLVKDFYKKKLPINLQGTNSKKYIGYNVQAAKTLDLSNLNGVIEYLPEELYIKVLAGTPIKTIEDLLEKHNQQLAFEPLDFGYINEGKSNKGSAAGCVATNYAGSRRFKVGSVRDFVLGFRGVNGKGDIIKSGGTVVKNVTGYDLSKVVSGSFGTLVALTELTLKVSPKKIFQNTVVIYLKDIKIVYSLFQKVLDSSNEISGAIYIPDEPKSKKFDLNKSRVFKFNDLNNDGPFLAIRLEGDRVSVQERLQDINKELELKKYKTSILDNHQSVPFWIKVNNLELFTNTKNNLIRAVIPPSNSEKLMKFLGNKFKYFIDWSGSLFWMEVPDNEDNKIGQIREFVSKNEGYMTIIMKSENFDFKEKVFSTDKAKLMISKKIKESFDPKSLFNPGRMYREI
ncbi:FAD-binding protein [Candidatus Pelagibacter sp.]|nr:FAD-binding protein [Candidatus Pelagibacter sp.]